MYYAFIVNPAAGTGFSLSVMQKLEEKLSADNVEYRIFQTEKPGHATQIAAELASDPDAAAVVSVGGDGTAGEVAAGLTGTGKTMGIIPAGTGNDFIKSAGIPNDPSAALQLILSGEARPIDTGTVNDRFFLNVCGTGFDVTVLDYAESEKEKHRGLTPYFLGLIKAIFHYKSVRLTVTADGEEETGEYLICSIANGRFIGGGIPICPAADIRDGLLDLVLIRGIGRWQIPFHLPGLMLSRALKFRITRHRKVKRVLIEGKDLRINIDGDIVSLSSVDFRINPASLHMIC
ncbi:MAG: diacylglycerol kinase family lipid kinase [Clostridiales bacterium]|nr:diacylglycerol kinase family lipid kinase [Clostridiales bacterium]